MDVTKIDRETAGVRGRGRALGWWWGVLIVAAIAPGQTAPAAPPDAGPPAGDAARAARPPAVNAAGFSDCQAVEVTGTPPAESLCRRPRKVAPADRCCESPVEVAILSGTQVLLRVDACSFVPPECTHSHGHGRMSADLRVLSGPTPEVVVVEGGCEMRAMMHGYVPRGVAAWTGCPHVRYRWNGKALIKQTEPVR